jgi:hypothetical protein
MGRRRGRAVGKDVRRRSRREEFMGRRGEARQRQKMDLGISATGSITTTATNKEETIVYSTAIPISKRKYELLFHDISYNDLNYNELGNSIIKDPHENRYTTTTIYILRLSAYGESWRSDPSDRIDWIDCSTAPGPHQYRHLPALDLDFDYHEDEKRTKRSDRIDFIGLERK